MLRDNLKRLREEADLTQDELAQRLHVVRQTVSKWERGASVPDADMLARIAALYGVSASSLLDEQPIPMQSLSTLQRRQHSSTSASTTRRNGAARLCGTFASPPACWPPSCSSSS